MGVGARQPADRVPIWTHQRWCCRSYTHRPSFHTWCNMTAHHAPTATLAALGPARDAPRRRPVFLPLLLRADSPRREAAAHFMRCDVPQRPHQPAQVGRSELLRSQQQRRREQEETAVHQRRTPRHQQSPLRRMWQNQWAPMFAWKGWRASATYPPSSSGSP